VQQSSQSAGVPLAAARRKLDPAEPACHCAEDAGSERKVERYQPDELAVHLGLEAIHSRVHAVPQRANIDLHSPTSGELAVPQPVEALPRALLAPELVAMRRQNLKLDASGSEVRAR